MNFFMLNINMYTLLNEFKCDKISFYNVHDYTQHSLTLIVTYIFHYQVVHLCTSNKE